MKIMTVIRLTASMNINEDNSYVDYDDIGYNNTDKENDTLYIIYCSTYLILIELIYMVYPNCWFTMHH